MKWIWAGILLIALLIAGGRLIDEEATQRILETLLTGKAA
jgi:hypothetical protein